MEKETWYSKSDARFFYGQGFSMSRQIFSWIKTLGSRSIAMIWAFSPFSPCPKCFCIGVHTLPPNIYCFVVEHSASRV